MSIRSSSYDNIKYWILLINCYDSYPNDFLRNVILEIFN